MKSFILHIPMQPGNFLHCAKFAALCALTSVMLACQNSGEEASTIPPAEEKLDTTRPTANLITPTPGQANVDVNTTITVSFSKDMDATTINSGTFIVTNTRTGQTVSEDSINYDNASRTAVFTPANRLDLLEEYRAEVTDGITDSTAQHNLLQPVGPWTFTVRDGSWQTAKLIETVNSGNATEPSVEMDNNNGALIVWQQTDAAGLNNIWSKRFIEANGWASWNPDLPETNIESATEEATKPKLAKDSNGNLHVVWLQVDSSGRQRLYAQRFVDGIATTIEPISVLLTGPNIDSWQIATGQNGDVGVVWRQYTTAPDPNDPTQEVIDTTTIHATRYVPNAGWIGWNGVRTITTTGHSPYIAMGISGDVIVTYINGSLVLFDYYKAATNSWLAATDSRLIGDMGFRSSLALGSSSKIRAAFDSNNQALVIFPIVESTETISCTIVICRDAFNWRFRANRYNGNSKLWDATPVALGPIVQTTELRVVVLLFVNPPTLPGLAVDDAGNITVVWNSGTARDSTGTNLLRENYANHYHSSTNWQGAEIIGADANSISQPILGMDDNGNALAIWYTTETIPASGGTPQMLTQRFYSSRYTAPTGWSNAAEFRSVTAETNTIILGPISFSPNGSGMVVWTENNGARSDVWGSHYE